MKRIVLFCTFALLLFCSSAAQAGEWDKKDITLEVTYQAINLIDYGQTTFIVKNSDRYYERNRMLGQHPSQQNVNVYFVVMALGHFLISDLLPGELKDDDIISYRNMWQAANIIYRAPFVISNHKIGIKIAF
ncbi:MAG: hypothetical protein HZB61_10390 [Nitrospirae bacterium]|nr:hypothetical protein [Nitrospirota bacterium]